MILHKLKEKYGPGKEKARNKKQTKLKGKTQ